MKISLKYPTATACVLAVGVLALPVSAQIYIYGGVGDPDIVLDTSNAFTGASGETLNIGSTGDATGPFAATTTALNSSATVNVSGSSSLQFLGSGNTLRTQNLTVNFADASRFLIDDASHNFRQGVTINYSSSAASVSTGNLIFQSGGSGIPTLNINSGSVRIGGLNPGDKNGLLNLNGGDFIASGVNYAVGADLFNINFTSTSSVFVLSGAVDISALDAEFADGLFQINGVDKAKTDFDVSFDGSDLTIAVIPEPSSFALLGGVLALGFVLRRRRS